KLNNSIDSKPNRAFKLRRTSIYYSFNNSFDREINPSERGGFGQAVNHHNSQFVWARIEFFQRDARDVRDALQVGGFRNGHLGDRRGVYQLAARKDLRLDHQVGGVLLDLRVVGDDHEIYGAVLFEAPRRRRRLRDVVAVRGLQIVLFFSARREQDSAQRQLFFSDVGDFDPFRGAAHPRRAFLSDRHASLIKARLGGHQEAVVEARFDRDFQPRRSDVDAAALDKAGRRFPFFVEERHQQVERALMRPVEESQGQLRSVHVQIDQRPGT